MHTPTSLLDQVRETKPVEALRELQLRMLRKTVRHASRHSPLYGRTKGIRAIDARFASLADFTSLPFTTKQDLIEGGMYGNLCVPREDIAEVHFSSGTSNTPVPSFLTRGDIENGSAYLARTWHMQGVRKESIFAMFASYGLFSAGLINHYALQKIGAFVIPAGNASASKAFDLLEGFGADSCAAVASYYSYLIAMAKAEGFDLRRLKLKHMVAGGEPFSEGQRRFIEDAFDADLYDQYGLCEINTGLAGECREKDGLHILADYAYPEIIDPDTAAPLGDGHEGELVLTTFHKDASPLIRYRTGDITKITHAPCRCGRTMPRIARVKRRVTDTLFYKGIKIEKPFVTQALEEISAHLNPYMWQIEIATVSGRDQVALKILLTESEGAIGRVTDHVRKKFGFDVKVASFKEEELARLGSGKLKHFVDNRDV